MPFLPNDINGLHLWLKPRNQPTLAFGDPVTLWPDESRNGYDVTQADPTKAPTYDVGANLLPCLRFNGVDQYMTGVDMNLFWGNGPKAMFVLFEPFTLAGTQTIFSDDLNPAGVWLKIMTVAGPPTPPGAIAPRLRAYNDFTGGGTDQVESLPLTLGVHVALWQHFGNSLRVGLDDPFPDELNGTGTTIALQNFILGRNQVGAEHFNGRLYEVCAFKVGMQEREVSKVRSYLRSGGL